MLDLVIPVYNDRLGLCRTLMSIGTDTEQPIFITIVDDASTDIYDDIIEIFEKFFPIRLLQLPKNSGPGVARQQGLDAGTQPFITFVDCGDTFTSPLMLSRMLNTVKKYDTCDAWFWSHTEKETEDGEYVPIGSQHNRMHGKIYRREFLINNNIHFSEKSPRANEDIGFNVAVRLICFEHLKQTGEGNLFVSEENAINWITDNNSLVRANDCAFYFKDQNMGLALNMEHALNIAKAAGVSEEFLIEEVYRGMATEYCFYLSTKAYKTEYIKEAFEGAMYYYKNIFRFYKNKEPNLIRNIYYKILGALLIEDDNPIQSQLLPLDYKGFLNKLEKLVLKEENVLI